LILSMSLFGTIGIFRKYIPLPSSLLAMSRGLIGTVFLLLVVAHFIAGAMGSAFAYLTGGSPNV